MIDSKRNILLALALAICGILLAGFGLPHFYLLSHQHGLHIILEFISIFMAFLIFNIAWLMKEGLKDKPSRFVLFFSLIFFAVGVVDFLHILTFEGIPDFIIHGSASKAMLLWLLGRYLIILSFLAAFFSAKLSEDQRPSVVNVVAFFLVIVLPAALLAIFILHSVPSVYAFTQHITEHVLPLSYMLVLLHITAFYCLWQKQNMFKPTVFSQLCYFLIFSMLAEILANIYPIVFDINNLLGHCYKVLSYYFLYRAVALSGIADHFYILSEMAKMSAKMFNRHTDVKQSMEIQLDKLKDLIPQAERIVFYLHEEEQQFRLSFSWGKYQHLTPPYLVLDLRDFEKDLEKNLSVTTEFPMKLVAHVFKNIPSKLSEALQSVHQCMYIPLVTDEAFHGFILLYIFNPLKSFSARDNEKAAVFQQFASLSLAQVKHQEIIHKLSYEDSLTGLPNRRAFFEALKKADYDAARYGTPYTVVSLDMNDLKYINDHLGHAAGDQALKLISKTLSTCIRQSDVAARLGGDEFGILYVHMNYRDGQEKIAELKKLFSYLTLPEYQHTFSIALGGASCPEEAPDVDTLLHLSDDRMYAHKNEYKSDGLI